MLREMWSSSRRRDWRWWQGRLDACSCCSSRGNDVPQPLLWSWKLTAGNNGCDGRWSTGVPAKLNMCHVAEINAGRCGEKWRAGRHVCVWGGSTQWVGSWAGPRTALNNLKRTKIFPLQRQTANLWLSSLQPAAIPTELPVLSWLSEHLHIDT
jgi:hypothetical protein